MGGSSSSSTQRHYETTNIAQQGEANLVGSDGNTVTIQHADALALEHIADVLGEGVSDTLQTGRVVMGEATDLTRDINRESLEFAGDTLEEVTDLARRAQQAGESGTKAAMDFVAGYTERAQIGDAGEGLRSLVWIAGAVAVAVVGLAYAARGSA